MFLESDTTPNVPSLGAGKTVDPKGDVTWHVDVLLPGFAHSTSDSQSDCENYRESVRMM
jgi:hypothetical protein